jgi:hypothetical protein
LTGIEHPSGINLWLLEDEAIRLDPEPLLSFGCPEQHLATGKFGDLKRQFFGRAADRAATRLLESRLLAFRYALFTHEQIEPGGSQGARPIGKADLFGDDILIALGRLSRASILSMGALPTGSACYMLQLRQTASRTALGEPIARAVAIQR